MMMYSARYRARHRYAAVVQPSTIPWAPSTNTSSVVLSCPHPKDMLSSRNYHYTSDSSLVALVLTQIRLRVVPMAQEYQLRYGE